MFDIIGTALELETAENSGPQDHVCEDPTKNGNLPMIWENSCVRQVTLPLNAASPLTDSKRIRVLELIFGVVCGSVWSTDAV